MHISDQIFNVISSNYLAFMLFPIMYLNPSNGCLLIKMLFSEGRGSLYSLLKARGWATSLSAGVGDEGMYRSSLAYIFGISIHLTDYGLEKVLHYYVHHY